MLHLALGGPLQHDDAPPSVLPALSPTPRTQLRRYPQRGRTDRAELYEVLDKAMMCFLGTVVDGCPRVTPMVFGRIDDTLYLHGSVANQALLAVKNGGEVCVTVANVNGLVLANSLYHHSVNFECVMVYGTGRVVTDDAERVAALQAAGEQLVPGRATFLRPPSTKELAATMVVAIPLAEASLKIREGAPFGEPEDYEQGIWSGVVPLFHVWGDPEPDPLLRPNVPVPEHVTALVARSPRSPST